MTMNQDHGFAHHVQRPLVVSYTIRDDGTFPNNGKLALLVYPNAVELPKKQAASVFENVFAANAWSGSWRNGIYGFHHYHSTAHEVLGVYAGNATVQFGGNDGVVLMINRGDVAIIPAGVAHKNLSSSLDFRCVGAYPKGQRPDMNYGKPDERPRADDCIANVATPRCDPVFGSSGPLTVHWIKIADLP